MPRLQSYELVNPPTAAPTSAPVARVTYYTLPLGSADLAYVTGQELTDKIEQAGKLKKLFYSRRFWVLPPPRRAAEPGGYFASLAAAKALHREVRRAQTSRFVRLLSYLSPATLGYVALMASSKVIYAAVGPLEAVYSSAMGEHERLTTFQPSVLSH